MKQAPIQLTFSCQEDLEAMSCTSKGRFCSACQKEVIDFTKMSYSDIQRIRGEQTEMCGMFRAEQIDPSLHPIELPKVRTWAYLSTLLVSLNFGTTSAQSTVDPKVEQSQGASNAPNLTPAEAKEKAQSGQHISMSLGESVIHESDSLTTELIDKRKQRYINRKQRRLKKKFFWSKRFPFIHRKSNFKGRF